MSNSTTSHVRRARLAWPAAAFVLALLGWHCSSPAERDEPTDPDPATAWSTVFEVLTHPRCMNCHPVGDVPLQGDDSRPHAQNVQRGPDGTGLFAMRCATCHQDHNLPGANLPPGAPNWHLPTPEMPLVFEQRNSGELCRQLRDPKQNGGKTPEQILHHVSEDALVLWGWEPGIGRTPVSIPHAEFVAAMRVWVEGGCDCPE